MLDTKIKKQLDDIASTMADVPTLKAAQEQIEQRMAKLTQSLEQRVKDVRASHWDERGRYRGVFASEDQARGFGLMAIATIQQHAWASEAFKAEFPDVAKDFTTANGEALIPEGYNATIVDLIESYGVFEPNALRYPMSDSIVPYPKKTGRTIAVPMGESTAVAETKPTIIRKTLTARKWGAYTEAPMEITEDSAAAFGEMIAMDMAEAHALAADTAGFLGAGNAASNQITGVVNALVQNAIAVSASETWGGLTLDDHTRAVSVCTTKTFSGAEGSGPKWYCSHQYFWQVMVPLTLAAGGVTAGEIAGRRQLLFLGYPVELAQVLPSASAANSIGAVFGNLRKGAVFGDRRQFTFKKSEHFKFDEDVLAMLSTRRYDIQVHGAGTGAGGTSVPEVLSAVKTKAAA